MPKTLHLALCDTSFPDRKQMERLITRESDARRNQCLIYMETFGSSAALLTSPLIYDAYFLDIPEKEYSALHLAADLRKKGIGSPVVFCISTMDYRENTVPADRIYFLNKPVRKEELSKLLDEILIQKEKHHVPTIEFRDADGTYYLEAKNIVYMEHKGLTMLIHMKDGSVKTAHGELSHKFLDFSICPAFFMPGRNYIVNGDCVTNLTNFKMTLCDSSVIPLSFGIAKKIRKLLQNIQ